MKLDSIAAVAGAALLTAGSAAFAGQGGAYGTQGGHGTSQEAAPATRMPAAGADPSDTVVTIIQERLIAHGYEPGAADGKWGPESESALRRFQQEQNLETTGQIDQQTLAALLEEEGTGVAGGEGEEQEGPQTETGFYGVEAEEVGEEPKDAEAESARGEGAEAERMPGETGFIGPQDAGERERGQERSR